MVLVMSWQQTELLLIASVITITMRIVWTIRRKIIRTVLSCVVYHSCPQRYACTHEQFLQMPVGFRFRSNLFLYVCSGSFAFRFNLRLLCSYQSPAYLLTFPLNTGNKYDWCKNIFTILLNAQPTVTKQ